MKTLTTLGGSTLFCCLFAFGCATNKAQLPPQTATSLVDLRHALASGKISLQRTSTALRDLASNPRSNTKRQIELIGREMDDLKLEELRIRDINTHMQAKADEHFAAWKREIEGIENPSIAAAGMKRQERSQATMEEIRLKLDEAEAIAGPYISNLRDLNRFLQQDPTVDGVSALLPSIRQTLNMESKTVRQLDGLIAHIDAVTRSVE